MNSNVNPNVDDIWFDGVLNFMAENKLLVKNQ